MEEQSIDVHPTIVTTEEYQTSDLDHQSDTSGNASTSENYRDCHYGYHSSNCSDDEDDDTDPYQELFMNAYRSAPNSSDEDDGGRCTNNNIIIPEAKPLSLMEDWDLWDYMDEDELNIRLKNHPRLFEEITRKRKRKLLDEEDAVETNDGFNKVLNTFVKYIRTEPVNDSS